MNHSDSLPLFERGFGRVKLALKSTLKRAPRSSPAWLGEQPAWRDDLLSQGYNVCGTKTLDQLGYAHSPHRKIAVDTITGVAMVQRLFTAEGVAVLQDICSRLEQGAGDSDWIISRRTRGVTALSPFLNDMMCSRAFLLAVSRIAGVPLVPYPMLNARSQINYFYPKPAEQQQQLGMWHTDGTNYVLNIVLSDRSDYSGESSCFITVPSIPLMPWITGLLKPHGWTSRVMPCSFTAVDCSTAFALSSVADACRWCCPSTAPASVTIPTASGTWPPTMALRRPSPTGWGCAGPCSGRPPDNMHVSVSSRSRSRNCTTQGRDHAKQCAIPDSAANHLCSFVEFRLHWCPPGHGGSWRNKPAVLAVSVGQHLPPAFRAASLAYAVVGAGALQHGDRFLAQFAYLVSVYIAIRGGLPAGIAAIICALQPLITASMSNRDQHERSGRQEWVGLGVGFAGVSVVIFGEYNLSTTRLDLWLYALPLIAAITLSIATLYQRRQSVMATDHSKDGLLMPLFLQSTATLVLLTATGLPLGLIEVPASTQVWAAVAWLTLFSTFIAYLSLWILLTKLSATRVSALVYLEPPVTLLWAALMFGDAIHWTTYVGIAVVATGLAITRNPRRSGRAASVEHGGTP